MTTFLQSSASQQTADMRTNRDFFPIGALKHERFLRQHCESNRADAIPAPNDMIFQLFSMAQVQKRPLPMSCW
jgi:hypothetical protein